MENSCNVSSNVESKKTESIIKEAIQILIKREVNLLIVGETGVGKSSTIQALFDIDVEVGAGMKPTTMEISKYHKENLTIYDSPGLGEEKDEEHRRKILNLLEKKDSEGKMLIDLVLVLLDFSHRDFGTAYKFINEVIPRELKQEGRVVVALNKCDKVDIGEWNKEENKPDTEMKEYLDGQIKVVQERIEQGGDFKLGDFIVYYSAGKHNAKGERTREPYNVVELFCYIMEHIPTQKRVALVSRRNQEELHSNRDENEKYEKRIEKSLWDTVLKTLIPLGTIAVKFLWEHKEEVGQIIKVALESIIKTKTKK